MPMVDMGVSENRGTYLGVLIIRILLFRVLCYGPLFSETPIWHLECRLVLADVQFSNCKANVRYSTIECG